MPFRISSTVNGPRSTRSSCTLAKQQVETHGLPSSADYGWVGLNEGLPVVVNESLIPEAGHG